MLLVWYCIAETRKWQKNHGKHICQGTTLKECNLERKKKELVVLREDIERPGDSIGEIKEENLRGRRRVADIEGVLRTI